MHVCVILKLKTRCTILGLTAGHKIWDLGHLTAKRTNPQKPLWMLHPLRTRCLSFFVSVFLSLSHYPPHPPLFLHHLSLFPPLALSRGPSLNPRERGRSLGWRGRAGNPCSDPGQFNYPVFFRCATRVPISQPTPLMRPGLASLTFNDLPIDALGPTAHTQKRTHTHRHTHIYTQTHTQPGKCFLCISFSVKEFTKLFCKAEDQEKHSQNKYVCLSVFVHVFACLCGCVCYINCSKKRIVLSICIYPGFTSHLQDLR